MMSNLVNAPVSQDALYHSANSTRPNIIFILIDDMGWRELGAYGNRFNETPNIDRLAAEGLRFTQGYTAAPVCSPTRASLMTGQYPARIGITDYLEIDDEHFLSPDYITLNERLKSVGYVSGLVGKWHLMGDYQKRRGAPQLHGFDEVIVSETQYIGPGDYFHPYFFMPDVPARESPEYLTDRLNSEALDFIKRNRERPFFLFLSHYAVHTELAAKPDLLPKYGRKPGVAKQQNNPTMAAMLESVDEGVGHIMRTLDAFGLSENTLIVFTSDNGGEIGVTTNAPLRAGKSTLYEGGIRVPVIVRWPARIKPGTTDATPIITADYYPTFLQAAGVSADHSQVVDGVSLMPLFQGSGRLQRDTLYWHYPLAKPHFLGGPSSGAIRSGDFKLIEFYDTGKVELYNLRNDIGEQHDLAATMPEEVVELRRKLAAWRQQVGTDLTPMRPDK